MDNKYIHAISVELRELNKTMELMLKEMKKTREFFVEDKPNDPCDCPDCKCKTEIGSQGQLEPEQSDK